MTWARELEELRAREGLAGQMGGASGGPLLPDRAGGLQERLCARGVAFGDCHRGLSFCGRVRVPSPDTMDIYRYYRGSTGDGCRSLN